MNFLFKKCGDNNHRFEPRYDVKPNIKTFKQGDNTAEEVVSMLNAVSEKKYVHDICVRCGKIVNRQDN